MTIFKKMNQYNFSGSFEGWLKRITINTAIQKYRKQPLLDPLKESENYEAITEEVISFNWDIDVLLLFIQELPDRYRLVFNLYVLDNYSHKEIANLLQISEGTSKSNLSRAKQILKEKLLHYKNSNHINGQ